MGKGYRQFCPVAQAAEILAERWTLLVIRELLSGSERFSELQRGVPQMSPSLLSRRLETLVDAGVIRRDERSGSPTYRLTDAGRELQPVVESIGAWGRRWARQALPAEELDASLLMWDVHRRIDLAQLPGSGRRVIRFDLSGAERGMARWWLVVQEDGAIDVCLQDPGFEVSLRVESDLRTMTECWIGDRAIRAAIADGELHLEGDAAVARAFPEWMQRSVFADVERPT